MGRSRTQERINLSQNVYSRRLQRLQYLKNRLAGVIDERTNMSENYLSIGSQQKYKHLNDRIAKLNFEIMLLEGGTIKDNHIAEWINENRWKYQNPYTGEVRDFKVGDRFNLDYGGYDNKNKVVRERSEWTGGDHGHKIWNGDAANQENFQTFQLEKIKENIEELQIRKSPNTITQGDQVYVVDGKIVKNWQPGATKMLRSDYLRETDLDSFRTEHNIVTQDLIESLKISNGESKRDLSLTNGTQ